MYRPAMAFAVCALVCTANADAYCFEEAATRYSVDARLLRAIAQVESAGRADAVNRSHEPRTGTYDLGLMQINSSWLPALSRFGIDEAALLRQPCVNVLVGAWILSQLRVRHGTGWQAVGAYNASCTSLKGQECERVRTAYAWRVYRAMAGLGGTSEGAHSPPPARAPSTVLQDRVAGTERTND